MLIHHRFLNLILNKEVNLRSAKCPLVFNGRLANRGLTSLVKEATDDSKKKVINRYDIDQGQGWGCQTNFPVS